MTVHGVPYQYTEPKAIFLRTYIARDGTKREKWFRTDPSTDASWRYMQIVERTLRRHEGSKHPLRIRRFAFQVWFRAFGPTVQPLYLMKYKLDVNIADKATQEKQQVEQAQEKLDQTTEAAKQTLGELQQELNAKEALNEQGQKQVPNTQG